MSTQLTLLAPTSQVTTSIEAKFDEFWAVMPKRGGASDPKRPALLKFTALVRRGHVDPDRIVAGARAYAASRAGEDPRFNVMAMTFLNQYRFDDDYSPTVPNGTGPGPTNCGSSYADFARKLAANEQGTG